MTPAGRAVVENTPFPLQHSLEQAFGRLSGDEITDMATQLERLVELMAVSEMDAGPMLEIVGLGTAEEHEER